MTDAYARQCGYCKDSFAEGEACFDCPRCAARYHVDCWKEYGNKCSVFGCTGFVYIGIREEEWRKLLHEFHQLGKSIRQRGLRL